jgi:hypothetical protein
MNEGRWDRGLRLAGGVFFGSIAILGTGGAAGATAATVMSVVLFATAAVGFCPLYALLGIDTSRERVKG